MKGIFVGQCIFQIMQKEFPLLYQTFLLTKKGGQSCFSIQVVYQNYLKKCKKVVCVFCASNAFLKHKKKPYKYRWEKN